MAKQTLRQQLRWLCREVRATKNPTIDHIWFVVLMGVKNHESRKSIARKLEKEAEKQLLPDKAVYRCFAYDIRNSRPLSLPACMEMSR